MTTLLRAAEGLEVVGEASTGEEGVRLASELQADVLLMDIQMPGINGIAATQRILHESPHICILLVTMFEDDASVFNAMRAGARGHVLKDAETSELLRAIRAAESGEAILSPSVASRLIDFFATHHPALTTELFPSLTERERDPVSDCGGRRQWRDCEPAGSQPEDGEELCLQHLLEAPGGRSSRGRQSGAEDKPRQISVNPNLEAYR